MREPYGSDAVIESILTGSCQTLSSDIEPEIVPEWLADQLRLLFDNVASEPLPEAFVRLLRQLNEVEDI